MIMPAMAEKTTQWEYALAKAYMQNVPERVRDDLSRAYRDLPSVGDDVRRYAQRVIDGRGGVEIQPYRTMGLLTRADADRVRAEAGMDVDGFDFALDPFAVRHVISGHGDAAVEMPRGQRDVTAADFGKLPKLFNAYQSSRHVGASRSSGRELMNFSGIVENETISAVLEIRTGRKMLALISMWVGSP